MKLSKLTIYEFTPNSFFGKDKKGNEYKICSGGEIRKIEKGSIRPECSVVSLDEVKLWINGKRLKSNKSLGLNVKDLKWWEMSDEYYCGTEKDKEYKGYGDFNVYAIDWHSGEIVLRPDINFNPMWFGADERLVEEELAKAKEYAKTAHLKKPKEKVNIIKNIFKKISNKIIKYKNQHKIRSPEKDGFITYYSCSNRVLYLTEIMFTEERIIITESEDDFDCSSMERNEYYIIEPDNYLNLLNKLEKEYKPMPIRKLSSNTKKYYQLFKNDDLKKIFLLFLSLIGYDKNVKEDAEKYMEGEELIKLLCGDEIKFKKEYYIK